MVTADEGTACCDRLEWVRSGRFTPAVPLPIPDAMLEYFLGYSVGQKTATRAATLARSAAVADGTLHTNRIEDVNERIDRLVMIIRAMWALLEEQGMTAERLMAKMEEIDLQDGVADGQVRSEPAECPACQSKVAPGLRACQLCGTEVRPDIGHPLGQV